MGNDHSSRNTSPPSGNGRPTKNRRPSDLVARVNLHPAAGLAQQKQHFEEVVSRRLTAFRTARPKSSAQLVATRHSGTSSRQRPSIPSEGSTSTNLSPTWKIPSASSSSTFSPNNYPNWPFVPTAAPKQPGKRLKSQTREPDHLLHCTPQQRNRRMSVAGDEITRPTEAQQPESRGGQTDPPNSGASTPQRRFSRAKPMAPDQQQLRESSRRLSRAVENCTEQSSETVAEHLKISSYQSLMLQQSWSRIKANVFNNVFRELASKNIVAKELLQKISIVDGFTSAGSNRRNYDQKEHVRLLVELFDFTVQNINSNCSKIIQQKCTVIGETHFSVFGTGNEAQIWEDLGETLTQAIARADTSGSRTKRESIKAWISVISFLVDAIKAGYVKMFKRKSLSRNSGTGFAEVVTLASNDDIAAPQNRPITPTLQFSALHFVH